MASSKELALDRNWGLSHLLFKGTTLRIALRAFTTCHIIWFRPRTMSPSPAETLDAFDYVECTE